MNKSVYTESTSFNWHLWHLNLYVKLKKYLLWLFHFRSYEHIQLRMFGLTSNVFIYFWTLVPKSEIQAEKCVDCVFSLEGPELRLDCCRKKLGHKSLGPEGKKDDDLIWHTAQWQVRSKLPPKILSCFWVWLFSRPPNPGSGHAMSAAIP